MFGLIVDPSGELLSQNGSDFQHQNDVFIDNDLIKKTFGGLHLKISSQNLILATILLSVRQCISANWLNDRDQFLYPNEDWNNDYEFQNDCYTYALFHGQNNISFKYGTNHWIPFTEEEVNARGIFESHFMTDFIKGKIQPEQQDGLFGGEQQKAEPMVFSPEAQAVFNAGRELWLYYHKQPRCNVNASL